MSKYTLEFDEYLRLRGEWQDLIDEQESIERTPRKDALYNALTKAWNRLTKTEKACAGFAFKAERYWLQA